LEGASCETRKYSFVRFRTRWILQQPACGSCCEKTGDPRCEGDAYLVERLLLPIYDGDLEEADGVPDNAEKLKTLFADHDGILIACPEYNAGITPLLKNALDWISRVKGPGDAYRGKVFALGAASPGGFGGMRGLIGMRTILEVGLGAMVLPQMVSVAKASAAFNERGDLTDERASANLDKMIDALLPCDP
jgi:chromate reductase